MLGPILDGPYRPAYMVLYLSQQMRETEEVSGNELNFPPETPDSSFALCNAFFWFDMKYAWGPMESCFPNRQYSG